MKQHFLFVFFILTGILFYTRPLCAQINVSGDPILKTLAEINTSLTRSTTDQESRIDLTMLQFRKIYENDSKTAEKYYLVAKAIWLSSDSIVLYLHDLKQLTAGICGGWPDDSKTGEKASKKKSKAAEFMLDNHENNGARATLLRHRLQNYISRITSLCASCDNRTPVNLNINDPLTGKNGRSISWEEDCFKGLPDIAVITKLSRLQNDIRLAELEIINFNFNMVQFSKQPFNTLEPIINTETPGVIFGQKFIAEIFLGAYNCFRTPKIEVNGRMLSPDEVRNGKGHYEVVPSTIGDHYIDVKLMVNNPSGKEDTFTTHSHYQVFAGGATIVADKMNMLYIGLDNPISAAASGFTPSNTFVTISGGGSLRKDTLSGGYGHYKIKPDGSAREITVRVAVRLSDGSLKQMGTQIYRVRKIPHPEVLFGTKSGGVISRGEIATVSQINSGLGEGFAYEGLRFNVDGYKLVIARKNGESYFEEVNGNRISEKGKEALSQLKTGDVIVINNVAVSSSFSGPLILGGLSLTVK